MRQCVSLAKIRAALESALADISPAIDTAWENVKFTPTTNQPYQRVFLKVVADVPVQSCRETIYRGVLYIRLFYPLNVGSNDITSRFEAIKTKFALGSSHSDADTIATCIINYTPEFNTEGVDGDRFTGLVKIRFYTNRL